MEAVIRDALDLARLRRDGAAVAVRVRPVALPADPGPLWDGAVPRRMLLADREGWMLAEGTAAERRADGPGRSARCTAAVADLRARCVITGADEPRLLTCGRFDDRGGAAPWTGVPGVRVWIPARLRVFENGAGWESRAVAVRHGDDPGCIAAALDGDPAAEPGLAAEPWPPPPGRLDERLADAIEWLGEGIARKVVVATAEDVPAPADPVRAVLAGAAAGAGCAYAIDLPDGALFAGVTPEELVRIDAGRLHTMALAGTALRDADPARDAAAGEGLLQGTKERKEHNLVVEHLLQVLRGRCRPFPVPDRPQLRSVPRLHHLCTPIAADLADADPVEVAAALHPTPAVAGLPVAAALRHLARHEGLERGLYAGVAGWTGAGMLRTWVLLRGGLVRDGRARLFAGAGLVEASDPAAEAAEIRGKLAAVRALLGG
ncbi:MAG: hypothetical protein RLZZ127_2397 [Planctomycetota bacterium]|jgi:isochorismate synthase